VGGCCAIRPLSDVDYNNACEMKRLYVLPAFRGLGLGRQLAEKAIGFAKDAGYGCILLDTLDEMETARGLYQELGFSEVEPYYHNPIPGAHYLRATL
jgi:putative acetyltransferase